MLRCEMIKGLPGWSLRYTEVIRESASIFTSIKGKVQMSGNDTWKRAMEEMVQNRWVFVIACTFSFFLLLGAYANHFHNSFHFDDSHVIENNLYIRNLRNIPLFFVDGRTFSSLPSNA